ncbi:gp161 [Sphingomonas phage PAU]|uniref:gp161 n=1 Tax=Sphingomonas phage PAU TaxID=1150991 RepID=UPI00025732ED|nr:gp161 [Sphingomonas phage PAU]AFF28159.1 gp161 [Sphingomonas phage PAU]
MLNFINSKIGVISMVLGFIFVALGVNRGFLDHEDISIMYWLIGSMLSIYVLIWLFISVIVYGFVKKLGRW